MRAQPGDELVPFLRLRGSAIDAERAVIVQVDQAGGEKAVIEADIRIVTGPDKISTMSRARRAPRPAR